MVASVITLVQSCSEAGISSLRGVHHVRGKSLGSSVCMSEYLLVRVYEHKLTAPMRNPRSTAAIFSAFFTLSHWRRWDT